MTGKAAEQGRRESALDTGDVGVSHPHSEIIRSRAAVWKVQPSVTSSVGQASSRSFVNTVKIGVSSRQKIKSSGKKLFSVSIY